MQRVILLAETIRLKQWIKNLSIFVALVFSGNLLNFPLFIKTVEAFILFCLLASAIYIINDLFDIKEDQTHPTKKKRPLASGALNKNLALTLALVLLVISIGLSFVICIKLGIVFICYAIIFIAYSYKLKHIAIIDVLIISIGFVLRIVAGAIAINVPVSHWLLICTMFLALFLGFCKRRAELELLNKKSASHRQVLSEYSPYFIDQMIAVTTASIVISYTLYTVSSETIARFGTDRLIYTVPFVLFGIFRYLYLVHQKKTGSNPTEIALKDKIIIIDIILWAMLICFMIYGQSLYKK